MIKKLENFWKSLGNNESQISPIPPEGYGDRFIKFITGVTKTREEAHREAAEADAQKQAEEVAAFLEEGRKRSGSQHLQRTATDNSVIQKAETQAAKTESQGANEDERPERTLLSVRSPSAERGGNAGMVLPVVEEAGEASSTGGRSGHEERPVTPPKDERPPTPPKDGAVKGHSKDGVVRSSSWKDKALPVVPSHEEIGNAL
jgi:1-phosphatidylinositol-4-phosphate 5-kinase